MKKHNLITCIISSFFVLGTAITLYAGLGSNVFASKLKGAENDNKLVLNKDNYATVAEVGTFNDPINDDKITTRKTNLGNDIKLQFCSGKGVTNNDGDNPTKFCQMPGSQYGWVTNKDKLNGINNIKITVQQSSASFRIDFSNTSTLEGYYYTQDPKPSYVAYRTETYTGSTSYSLDFDESYCYFRFQSLGSALSLTSLEISYSCTLAPVQRGILKTNDSPIDISPVAVSLGGKITVDYKYVDAVTDASKGISLFLGSDDNHRYGNYKLRKDSLDGTYDGVTFEILSDGYNRLTFDISLLTKVRSGESAPTTISQVSFKWFEVTKGARFDIKVEPNFRGVMCDNQDDTLPLGSYVVSEGGTITIDYIFADPLKDSNKGISLFIGSDNTHRFGNYKLLKNSLESSYSGVTFEKLSDGYNRMTFDISLLNSVRSGESAPTTISKVMFKWFEVDYGAYFDVQYPTKPTTFTMSGSEFKICNFTDIHVDDDDLLLDSGTVGKTIKYGIQHSNPDILVFSGDLVGKTSDLEYLIPYLDSFEIPYFMIFGNHDHEGDRGYDAYAPYINASKYGYIEKGPNSLLSEGNYTVKIQNSSGELVHGLILMDTGNKYTITDDSNVEYFTGTKVSGVKYGKFNGQTTYCNGTTGAGNAWDGIRGNQINWFKDTASELDCETTLICHAGFNEYVKAYEQYQDAVNKSDAAKIAQCAPIGECNMGEQVCGTVENTGLFEAIKLSGTKNVICGHDHLNDFSLMYQDVRLTYALKTGEGSYWEQGGTRSGYTQLTIDELGATSLDQIYFNPLS